jgi:hypothetical protein
LQNEKSNHKVDIFEIKKAIYYAKKYHGNQKRASGEPYYSHPLHPNIQAPIGLNINVVQNEKACTRAVVCGSVLGKKSSFNNTAMCTYNIKSKYSRNVPIESKHVASF